MTPTIETRRTEWFGALVNRFLLLAVISAFLAPGSAVAQEEDAPFRFEGIEWSADRDEVTQILTERDYVPVKAGEGTVSTFEGEFLGRSAIIRAAFSDEGRFRSVVASLGGDSPPSESFFEGVLRGIRFNHGEPCDLGSNRNAVTATWQIKTKRGVSTFQVNRVDGQVSFTYLAPAEESTVDRCRTAARK